MKDKNMYVRAAQNAFNLKHNGWLHQQIKEQRQKVEQEFEQKKQEIYEKGKKEGYEISRKKNFDKGFDRGYQKAFSQLDDYFTIMANVTLLLGQVELYGYAEKRLTKAIDKQNENIQKLNNGEKLDAMIEQLEQRGLIFREDMLENYMAVERKIESGELKIK